MNREEFLQGLQKALSGQIPPSAVQENLRYYDDYIRTEVRKGRTESEVMEELGDPRLIARTIVDTTPGAGDGAFEEYRSFGAGASGDGYQQYTREEEREDAAGRGSIRYYDLNKWYWKLLGIVLVIAVVTLVIAVIGGILTLVIPMLPAIFLAVLIMWFLRGPRQ